MSSINEKLSKEDRSVNVVIQAVDEEECPDGGLRAWLVVIGCFIITAVSFGFLCVVLFHFPNRQLTLSFRSFVSVTLTWNTSSLLFLVHGRWIIRSGAFFKPTILKEYLLEHPHLP